MTRNRKKGVRMRLCQDEKTALQNAIADIEDEVYIFGSRVDDSKKGGDIDILIFSKKKSYDLSQLISTRFFMAMDSKLDVVVFDKDNMSKKQSAFVNTLNLVRIK
jgi:uncharacterized protein